MRNRITSHPSRISRRAARISRALTLGALLPVFQGAAETARIRVIFENLSPENGALLTPPWIAIHDGLFEVFNAGEPASPELERLAEDGDTSPLSELFAASDSGAQATLNAIGPIPPGATVSATFEIDPAEIRFLSYTSMVIPSNDAFIGNDNPKSLEIFSENGAFLGLNMEIEAASVMDAGTEINDEIPENTAALAQTDPNTGDTENAMVTRHAGHLPPGSGGIVDQPQFANADFSTYDEPIARIRVEQIEPRPVYLEIDLANRAPENGVFFTPVWIGVHDGSFDFVDLGSPVSPELERLAEDGDTGPLSATFAAQRPRGVQETVANTGEAPVYAPGSNRSVILQLDATDPNHRYLSFASMVIPSNDALIANDDPKAYPLFDAMGHVNTLTITRMGAQVYDAGTEINSESSEATAFFGQSVPNTGTEENGIARLHDGFMPAGQGGILDAPMFSMADFTADEYPLFELNARLALSISEFSVQDGQFHLRWRGANAPFQVEWANVIGGAWNPIGAPTDARELSAPIDGSMRFFRVRSSLESPPAFESAMYVVRFEAAWSQETHPMDFPSNPHFSGLIGATHNADLNVWSPGSLATPGIQNMAETGSKSPLDQELQVAMSEGMVETILSGDGIAVSPGNVELEFTISKSRSMVSLVSMIAPSPDWFIGVHDVQLYEEGGWVDSLRVPLDPYDAGTDDGAAYSSPNANTAPQQPIQRITGAPFLNNGDVQPIGWFTFERIN